MNNRADLHTHTTASDGMFPPETNVRLAKEAGLAAIAITDHDTIAGIPEALRAGDVYGMVVVPGVELSTWTGDKDIHILGYGYALDDARWLERLQSLRQTRNRRNERILANLERLGMPITPEELAAAAGKTERKDKSVGRPHIAQAMLDKGYVSDLREAFDRWLGEGLPAYERQSQLSSVEAISWIQEAGGTAIIAHPGLYEDDATVLALLDGGADGLEAFHSEHHPDEERRYAEWAASRGKLVTGGSDFHGIKDGRAYHGAIGSRTVDAGIVQLFGRSLR
jgi:predicted metal-dependent phosphoesterase TrpH